jgi:hypothetical protein
MMPKLNQQQIIGSSQIFKDDIRNSYVLLKSHNENQIQNTQDKKLIQKSYGTRVMDIGGMKWETSISSPIVFTNGASFVDVLDYVLYAVYGDVDNLANPNFALAENFLTVDGEMNSVLKEGKIDFSDSKVDVFATIISDYPSTAWLYPVNPTDIPNWGGRVAKWYDCSLNMGFRDMDMSSCYIVGGDLSFTIDLGEHYFINSGKYTPDMIVNGYTVKGNLTIVLPIEAYLGLEYYYQLYNKCIPAGSGLFLQIGARTLDLSDKIVFINSLQKTIESSDMITARISFNYFAIKPE